MAGTTRPDRVVRNYPHRVATDCGSGALRDLLEWAGLAWAANHNRSLVFGLGGAPGFFYVRMPGVQSPVYLVGRDLDLERDLCARLGISWAASVAGISC